MPFLKLMSAKIHRCRVTEANRDYVGSITIDADILDKVGMVPLQEVEIVNLANGERWFTYTLPGERGSGCICPNGGGALLCQSHDLLIIFAYRYVEQSDLLRSGHRAIVAVAEELDNQISQVFYQELIFENGHIVFRTGDAPSEPDY